MTVRGGVKKESLRDGTYDVVYLRKCAQDKPAAFYVALREVVQAREGGFAWLAQQTGLGRPSLYKALSEHGNPSYATVHRVLEALGLDLSIEATFMMNMTITNTANTIMDRRGEECKVSIPDEAEQERFRALTEQLYAEADAIERQPGGFSNPDKARIAELVAEKHRQMGLKI